MFCEEAFRREEESNGSSSRSIGCISSAVWHQQIDNQVVMPLMIMFNPVNRESNVDNNQRKLYDYSPNGDDMGDSGESECSCYFADGMQYGASHGIH